MLPAIGNRKYNFINIKRALRQGFRDLTSIATNQISRYLFENSIFESNSHSNRYYFQIPHINVESYEIYDFEYIYSLRAQYFFFSNILRRHNNWKAIEIVLQTSCYRN